MSITTLTKSRRGRGRRPARIACASVAVLAAVLAAVHHDVSVQLADAKARHVSHERAARSRDGSGWAVCSFIWHLSGTDILQVQARRMSCSQAASALRHGRLLLTPAGPIFRSAAFTCRGQNLEPVTPAPSQLPELVRCARRHRREFRFIWIWG